MEYNDIMIDLMNHIPSVLLARRCVCATVSRIERNRVTCLDCLLLEFFDKGIRIRLRAQGDGTFADEIQPEFESR